MMRHMEWRPRHDARAWMVLLSLFCGGCLLPPPAVVPIAIVPNASSLETTSGNKLAVAHGRLHLVYLNGASLMYTSSADAQTWSPPATLAATAESPSIAATSNGVVGVVYAVGSTLYYRYRTVTAPWSTPVAISTWAGWGAMTSLAAYGTRMYVAWTTPGSGIVLFGDFIASSPGPLPFTALNPTPLCIGMSSTSSHPSIAVGPTSPSNPQPRARVAFFNTLTVSPMSPCASPSTSFGVVLGESGAGGWLSIASNSAGPVTLLPNDGAISLSMMADPSGNFLLAYSLAIDGIAWTQLVRIPSSFSPGSPLTSLTTHLSYSRSLVHLSPVTMPCPYFRITVSDAGTQPTLYAPTWYREGRWTSGSAPVWTTPMVPVAALGRNAQSIQWTRHYGSFFNGYTRRLRSVFGSASGAQHDLQAVYEDVPGPEPACKTKGTPGNALPQ